MQLTLSSLVSQVATVIDLEITLLNLLGQYYIVKLSRSHELTKILSNRRKLCDCPGISIKPQLTKEECLLESILLKERQKLIDFGTNQRYIKNQQ